MIFLETPDILFLFFLNSISPGIEMKRVNFSVIKMFPGIIFFLSFFCFVHQTNIPELPHDIDCLGRRPPRATMAATMTNKLAKTR